MNKKLLGSAAFGLLLLPAGTALAADPVYIPPITPVITVPQGNVVTVTLTQTLGKQDDDWTAETELEVDVLMPTGFGINLDLGLEVGFVPGNPPPDFTPGFRLTLYRELNNFDVGVFGGMVFDITAAERTWEVGVGTEGTLGTVDIEAEVRRETTNANPPVYVFEAAAGFHIGEVITITPGVEVALDTGVGPPPETTLALAIDLALGKVTLNGGIEQVLGGDRTLAVGAEVAVTDRFAINGGMERYTNGDPNFYWGGFVLELGN